MRNILLNVTILCLVLMPAACNYRFGGYREGHTQIESLNIPPFENRTRQVGIESIFTNDLVYEVGRGDRITLTDYDSADAVLNGVIKNLITDTISRETINVATERRVYLTIELSVKDRQGRVIWGQELNENEAYFVELDKVSTESSLREALEVISRRIAEKFHYRFTQQF